VTGGLANRLEPVAREQPARANVRSDPERAIKIECQRSNPSCWQTISSYLLDSPAVIPGNTVVGGKPERAFQVLCYGSYVVRRQSMN